MFLFISIKNTHGKVRFEEKINNTLEKELELSSKHICIKYLFYQNFLKIKIEEKSSVSCFLEGKKSFVLFF